MAVALVKPHNRWIIVASYLLALMLSVFPLFYEARWLRPEFLALFVIFWAIRLPQQLSLLWVFLAGCWLDVLEGVVLGQHALALVLVAYLALLVHKRMQHYVSWQQLLVVMAIIAVHQLLDNWIHSFQGGAAANLDFLMPAFISALLWPLVREGLDRLRNRFRVT